MPEIIYKVNIRETLSRLSAGEEIVIPLEEVMESTIRNGASQLRPKEFSVNKTKAGFKISRTV